MALNPKLRKGLAIGCGLVFFAFMLLFGGTVYFARQMGKDYKVVKELEEQLAENLGPSNRLPEGFTGLPSPSRIEAFLAVRQASAEWRLNMESSMDNLVGPEGLDQSTGFRHFLRMMKASRDLAPVFSGFWVSRNQALLAQEMGMGEYIYLYCLVYHSWLGFDPSDGARNSGEFLSGLGATGPREGRNQRGSDKQARGDDQDLLQRSRWARAQENRLMLPLMKQAAREAAAAGPDLAGWAGLLQQEVRSMSDDSLRVPFSDGVPAELAQRFEPFGPNLMAAYSAAVNPVELLFEDTWEGEK